MRLELDGSGEVDSGLKLEKEVEVNEAGGLRYGKGGTSEEKLPSAESWSAERRLRLRFFIMRGIILKLLFDFLVSILFPE
jgi:hypothetical protein